MRAERDEVRLASIGSRHAGGRRFTLADGGTPGGHPDDTYRVDQVYLQEFVPVDPVQRTPVLLVHGGGLTGACWESTPDGRPGWLWALLRAGLPVSVLDNVERGRAGWCSVPGVWPGEPVMRGERSSWTVFRIGTAAGYPTRTPFPGSRFPVDALDRLLCGSVPRWRANSARAAAALASVVDDMGPVVLIGHSQGGGFAARAAATHPGKVSALVLIEPDGLPADPGPAPQPPRLTIIGDNIAASPVATAQVAEVRAHTESVRARGGTADLYDLPARGITGNTHNPMMDTNSDEVAALITDWLAVRRGTGDLV